jgi:hypothetical protein
MMMHHLRTMGIFLILAVLAAGPVAGASLQPAGHLLPDDIAHAGYTAPPADDDAVRSLTRATAEVIWAGEVLVDPAETFTVTPFNTGIATEISRDTPLGALDAAAEAGDFSYEVWEADWGLYVYGIDDVLVNIDSNETMIWWIYDVLAGEITNDAEYKSLTDGETLRFIYAPWRLSSIPSISGSDSKTTLTA